MFENDASRPKPKGLLDLPQELLELICGVPALAIKDLQALSLTSRRFRYAAAAMYLWRSTCFDCSRPKSYTDKVRHLNSGEGVDLKRHLREVRIRPLSSGSGQETAAALTDLIDMLFSSECRLTSLSIYYSLRLSFMRPLALTFAGIIQTSLLTSLTLHDFNVVDFYHLVRYALSASLTIGADPARPFDEKETTILCFPQLCELSLVCAALYEDDLSSALTLWLQLCACPKWSNNVYANLISTLGGWESMRTLQDRLILLPSNPTERASIIKAYDYRCKCFYSAFLFLALGKHHLQAINWKPGRTLIRIDDGWLEGADCLRECCQYDGRFTRSDAQEWRERYDLRLPVAAC